MNGNKERSASAPPQKHACAAHKSVKNTGVHIRVQIFTQVGSEKRDHVVGSSVI